MPATYDTSVFINCPFDTDYRPLLEAVVFAVYDCGFCPRCALEMDDSSQVRIQKITSIIGQCRLAIHDISRTEVDDTFALPRFNMPFEFGIFVGAKAFGGREHRRKACVVFDVERYRFQKFISHIAGQDIREHRCDVELMIHQLRDFLSCHCPGAMILPGGRMLVERYHEFNRQLPGLCAKVHLDRDALTYRDLTNLVVSWVLLHPLPHHAPNGAHMAA
ncbi:MAG TPA: hypothetical protein VFJ82_04620 [Longimicrobium sp.]|nr:hypothetical protein [Longimicrobium sp.]